MTTMLSQLLVHAAQAHPDRPAVSSGSGELTYRELRDQALRLAGALVEHGIRPGDRVAICLPKDPALPVAIFGTLLAGGAYVPIDYLTPPARARVIAVDAEPVAVISDWRRMHGIASGDAAPARGGPQDNGPALHWLGPGWFDRDRSSAREPVTVSMPALGQRAPLDSPVEVPSSSLAYILYTSGSTGQPKGVAHTHASALAFVQWAVEAVGLSEADVVSQHASASFDLSVFDFFGAAAAAARLALVPASTFGRVSALCRFIVSAGVTVWYSVPSALLRVSSAESLAMLSGSALRQVIFAGEEIPVGPLGALWPNLPSSCRVANWYGPTETNVCTFHDLTAPDLDGAGPIPIGKPCPYATASLAEGELLIASDTLMSGYWRLPAATARKISAGSDGRPYYATGDLVSRDDARGFTFRGRVDRQLKVRGFRVQPEEVEHALEQLAEIDEAAVVKHSRGEAEVLAAVVRLVGPQALDHRAVSAHCARLLPPYMVPDVVLPVAELPRGSRGKTDYDAVLELLESSATGKPGSGAGTSPNPARSSVLAQ